LRKLEKVFGIGGKKKSITARQHNIFPEFFSLCLQRGARPAVTKDQKNMTRENRLEGALEEGDRMAKPRKLGEGKSVNSGGSTASEKSLEDRTVLFFFFCCTEYSNSA
jgi:hypothetical protein